MGTLPFKNGDSPLFRLLLRVKKGTVPIFQQQEQLPPIALRRAIGLRARVRRAALGRLAAFRLVAIYYLPPLALSNRWRRCCTRFWSRSKTSSLCSTAPRRRLV